MDFWKLFIVALMPVLKLLLLASVGAFLAFDRFDVLGENARKHLNTLIFFVFSPALASSNLAKTITLKSIVKLWFLPLNVLLTYIFGTALGWLLIKITRVPRRHLRGLVLGCCASDSSSPFGDVDVCYKNGLAFASLSYATAAIYFWSYVYNFVRIYSRKNSNVVEVDDSVVNPMSATETDPEKLSKCSTGSLVTAEDRSLTNHNVGQLEIECSVNDGQAKVPKKAEIMKQLHVLAKKMNLKVLLAPSIIGTIVGLIIGIVPQFQKVLVGEDAPLRVVRDCAVMLGDVSVPASTLLLGANLLDGIKGLGMHLPIIVGIIIVKFIALPAIGIGIVKGAIHFGLIDPDPLYQFVLLLQFAVPPAGAMSTLAQLFGAGEGECSVILLASYSCAVVSLALWCTFFLWLVL